MSAQLLGMPRDFEFGGKRYKISARDLHVEAQFAEWCKTEAGLDVWRMRAAMPPDFCAEQQKIYADKVHRKKFKWGLPDVHEVYWTEEGQKHILWLKMKRGEEKGGDPIERVILDDIAKNKAKWDELLLILWEQDEPDFFADLKEKGIVKGKPTTPPPSSPLPASPDSTSTT